MTYFVYCCEDKRTHERFMVRGRNKSVIPSTAKLVAVTGSYERPTTRKKEE